MVRTGESSVSVVTHFPDEELGKAAMDKIGVVREKAAEQRTRWSLPFKLVVPKMI